MSYVGPSAWGFVLDHFADLADRVESPTDSRPDNPPGDDLAGVRERYSAFFAEAESGGFGDPPAGEWTAQQVVAHIAVNDDLMATVCRSLIHGHPAPRFENAVSSDLAVLDRLVQACDGDLPRLVQVGRDRAEQLGHLLRRLDQDQRETLVHARLLDGGNVMVDAPRPWWAMAVGVQNEFHLPSHTDQLRALRREELQATSR